MRAANFIVMGVDTVSGALVIQDVGPWDFHPTITNDAENVVNRLFSEGTLKEGQRLFYYDSDDNVSELIIENKKLRTFQFIRNDLVKLRDHEV